MAVLKVVNYILWNKLMSCQRNARLHVRLDPSSPEQIHVTEEERKAILDYCATNGIELSQFIRQVCTSSMPGAVPSLSKGISNAASHLQLSVSEWMRYLILFAIDYRGIQGQLEKTRDFIRSLV